MQSFILAALLVASTVLAHAQRPNADSIWVDPCQQQYVPWGSDRSAVMKAAAADGYTFSELEQAENQPDVVHISYEKGNFRRMFSFVHGEYIGLATFYVTADNTYKNRVANRHLASYLAVADSIVSSKSVYLLCGKGADTKIKCSVSISSEAVSLQLINHTAMTDAILRARQMQE